jgi:hypothetical protein
MFKNSYLCINYICIITLILSTKVLEEVKFNNNDPIKKDLICKFYQIRGYLLINILFIHIYNVNNTLIHIG